MPFLGFNQKFKKRTYIPEKNLEVFPRKQVLPIKLSEDNTWVQGPQYHNSRSHFMTWDGKYSREWVKPPASANDRPLKKIRFDLYSDTRSIWPQT